MEPDWQLTPPNLENHQEWIEEKRFDLRFNAQSKEFLLSDADSYPDKRIALIIQYRNTVRPELVARNFQFNPRGSTPISFLRKWYLRSNPNEFGAEVLLADSKWRVMTKNEVLLWHFAYDDEGNIIRFYLSLRGSK